MIMLADQMEDWKASFLVSYCPTREAHDKDARWVSFDVFRCLALPNPKANNSCKLGL